VLMTDHLSLAPEMIEQMKRDFIDVISKYVEVDREKIEVSFEQQDKALVMLSNVPILAVNRTKPEEPPKSDSTPSLPRRKRRKKAAASTGAPSNASPAPAV